MSIRGTIFGIHSVTVYNRTTGKPKAIYKVLGGAGFEPSPEFEKLMGGSNPYPWATEFKEFGTSANFVAREVDGSTLADFIGGEYTEKVASATGEVTSVANKNGTSVVDATTGIASVTAISGSETDLKMGQYVLEATGADTVKLYCLTDESFRKQGTKKEMVDDKLGVVIESITVPDAGGTVDVTGFGLTITGGSGTVAFTTGDTAYFYVYPPYDEAWTVEFGQEGVAFQDVGILMRGANGSGQTFEVDLFKCKVAGYPINFNEKGFSESEITVEPQYCTEQGAVGNIRWVSNTNC